MAAESAATAYHPTSSSSSQIEELVRRMKGPAEERDSIIKTVSETTLLQTATIISNNDHIAVSTERKYEYLVREAREHAPPGHAGLSEQKLFLCSHAIHEYVLEHLRSSDSDRDMKAPEFVAQKFLEELESSAGMTELLFDLTGSSTCDSASEKTSLFLELLDELKIRPETVGPKETRPTLVELESVLRNYHTKMLNHGRLQLVESLPFSLQLKLFSDLDCFETEEEQGEYIRIQFEEAPGDAFDSVEFLPLTYKQLRILPPEIEKFKALKDLRLGQNYLTSLPNSLCHLPRLTQLQLNVNNLRHLPEDLGYLWSLEELSVDENKLVALPESIGELQNLRCASFCYNKLTTVPAEVGGVESLVLLHLEENPLTFLPLSLLPKKKQLVLPAIPFASRKFGHEEGGGEG